MLKITGKFLRLKKLGSSMYGGDDVEISGPDSKLLKFAKASFL